MHGDKVPLVDPPLKIYRGVSVSAIVMLVAFTVLSAWIVVGAIIERNPLLLLIAVGFLPLAFPFVMLRKARVEVWGDRFAVRSVRRWREYRFDECSKFEAKSVPGVRGAGLVVRFIHAPGGQVLWPRSVRWLGYNTLLPQLRGGAPRLARELNEMRARAMSADGPEVDPS